MDRPDRNGEDDLCAALPPEEQALAREVLARMVDKWGLWMLTELSQNGPLRFSRLMERVGRISQKSLSATLRQLERDGLVTRTMVVQVADPGGLRRDPARTVADRPCPPALAVRHRAVARLHRRARCL